MDGFVADVVRDDRIVEVQTGGFGALKRKLPKLLTQHRITLVHPIASVRTIVKITDDGETRRKSPKRGSLFDVFAELVYIPTLLDNPNLEIDVVMIEEEELRVFDGKKGRRRKGWVVVGRRLVDVVETHTLSSTAQVFESMAGDLPGEFTTADLASAMSSRRAVGQQAAYCFRAAGVAEICGKQGNALIYRRCA